MTNMITAVMFYLVGSNNLGELPPHYNVWGGQQDTRTLVVRKFEPGNSFTNVQIDCLKCDPIITTNEDGVKVINFVEIKPHVEKFNQLTDVRYEIETNVYLYCSNPTNIYDMQYLITDVNQKANKPVAVVRLTIVTTNIFANLQLPNGNKFFNAYIDGGESQKYEKIKSLGIDTNTYYWATNAGAYTNGNYDYFNYSTERNWHEYTNR